MFTTWLADSYWSVFEIVFVFFLCCCRSLPRARIQADVDAEVSLPGLHHHGEWQGMQGGGLLRSASQ